MIRPGSGTAPRPSTARPAARTALVAGVIVGGLVLAGCGAGQIAQTAYQANASGGATVTVNGIAVRDAQIAYGDTVEGVDVHSAGGDAPLEMYVINQGAASDRLVSASSPVATSVEITGEPRVEPGRSLIVGGSGAGTAGQTLPGETEPPASPPLDSTLPPPVNATTVPNAAAPESAPNEPSDVSPTGSADASGEAPAAGLQSPPPLAEIQPGDNFAQVVLTGLREDIRAGLSYEVVLTFERAGQVPVMVPVGYPGVPREPAERGE